MRKGIHCILLLCLCLPALAISAWAFEIHISTNTFQPGDTIAVEVTNPGPDSSKYSCWFNAKKYPLYTSKGDSLRVLLGIPFDFPSGKYAILIVERSKDKTLKKYKLVTIRRKKFPVSYVSLTHEQKELIASPACQEEKEIISHALGTENPQQFWEGGFILPVQGEITGAYGARRMMGRDLLWVHKGVDLKVSEGTPVQAANSGQVLLAEESFLLHGKTVIINHGQGVVTVYLHLNSINVKVGDEVKRGEIIGTVGRSGLATGAHLHWGLYVHAIPVNPLLWVGKQY